MLKIRISFSLLFILATCIQSYSNQSFIADTLLLPGKNIKKICSDKYGALWMIEGNNRNILRLKDDSLSDFSPSFQTVTNSKFTNIFCTDTNKIALSTQNDFVLIYKNGIFTKIDTSYGLAAADSSINSLYFDEYNRLFLAADEKVYEITSNDSLLVYNGAITHNTFISKDEFLIKYYSNSWSEYRIDYYNPRAIYGFPEFDETKIGKIICGSALDLYGTGYGYTFYLGTVNGLFLGYRDIWNSVIPSCKVNSIINISDTLLVGTDKGLYKVFYYDTVKIDYKGLDLSINDLVYYNGCVYAATNMGLMRYKNSICSSFKLSFDQNKRYINIYNNDSLTLTPKSNYAKIWQWSFGDGNFYYTKYAGHIYNNPGYYKIKLMAIDNLCTDSAFSYVSVINDSSAYGSSYKIKTKLQTGLTNSRINLIDIDNDGQKDIYLAGYDALPDWFYKNNNGVFTETSMDIDVSGTLFSVWADMNNDGLVDLITQNAVYENKGNLKFTEHLLLPGVYLNREKVELFDINNDGLLDVIILPNLEVLKNQGNFQFKEIGNLANTGDVQNILFADLNNDMKVEMILLRTQPNGDYRQPNYLLLNKGNGTFQKMDSIDLDMGSYYGTCIDIDNDQFPDLLISARDQNMDYLMNDSMNFIPQDNIISNEFNWFPDRFDQADWNNDGLTDLILQRPYTIKTYLNSKNGIFYEDTSNIIDHPDNKDDYEYKSNFAISDIDNDGMVEIFQSYVDKDSLKFYKASVKANNNWVNIDCYGVISNFNAVGTIVLVKSKINGKIITQKKVVEALSSCLNQNGFSLHFGLGNSSIIDTIIACFPSGAKCILSNLEVNKHYSIVEPLIKIIGDFTACANELPGFQMPPINDINYVWLFQNDSVGTGTKFYPKEEGLYKVIVKSQNLIDTSEAVKLTILPVTRSQIVFAGDSAFCKNDSSILKCTSKGNGLKYIWISETDGKFSNTKVTDSILKIKDSLSYACIITNQFNCHDTSGFLSANIYPIPVLKIPDTIHICEKDSVLLTPKVHFVSYLWQDTCTDSIFYAKDEGYYSLKVTNEFGCSSTFKYFVEVWQLPEIDLGKDVIIREVDTFLISPVISDYRLKYLWNDSSTSSLKLIIGFRSGVGKYQYNLGITDLNGCSNSDSITITIILGLNLDSIGAPVVFPNPSFGEFRIYLPNKSFSEEVVIRIFDLNGNILFNQKKSIKPGNSFLINFGNLASGVYFLQVITSNAKSITKIVVRRLDSK